MITLDLPAFQDQLKRFGARAKTHLCGYTVVNGQRMPIGEATEKFFSELLSSTNDPEKIKQRNEFMVRAENDPVCKAQLCGIRVEQFNNYVLASQNIVGMFFNIINLADDERPVIQNTTDQEIRVGYVGSNGEPKTKLIERDDDEALVNLHYLTSEKVTYRKKDIYRGTIVDAALQTLRLAYDVKNQMEAQAFNLLTAAVGSGGAFGAFTFTGKKANYTYLANSRIVTANLPSTNDIVLASNSGTTKFRYEVLRAAAKYANQWAGAFPEGDLVPTGRILLPALEAADIAEEIVPSGSTSNAVADQLLQNGWTTIDYLGKRWTLVSDNTLAAKTCYVEFNRKPGTVYLKPSQDRDVVGNTYELDQKNLEERYMQKVFGAYINSATRVNVCRIKYTT
jgi:hypothetical protein